MNKISILDSLMTQFPGISHLNQTDYLLADSYIQGYEYNQNFKYLSNQEWYETVHTFLLLVCEAEGI